MDYYDYVAPKEQEKKEGDHPANSIDAAADKLETGIEKAYEKLASTNWGSLWSSVKKQGEIAITRANTVAADVRARAEAIAISEREENSVQAAKGDSNESDAADSATSTSGGSNRTMLWELTKRAQNYIDELDQDIEELEKAAGSYLGKVGKDVKTLLRDTVSIDGPNHQVDRDDVDMEAGEDASSEVLFNVPEDIRNQIYSTRLDAQLHALHTSAEPFLATGKEDQFVEFQAKEFNLDKMTDTITEDLKEYPSLRKLMEQLVPDKVAYDQFWAKYYYMRKQISDQEQRRKKLLEQATESQENLGWDDEEDEDEGSTPTDKKTHVTESKASRPSSSEASYDVVSKTSALGQTDDDEDDWE